MTDPKDLRKIETWLRDCKADLWMTEVCEDAADDIERLPAMLKRAFYEGFNFTREGWNGKTDMTDPKDLRKIETWLRDCKADLWMTEVCEDAADDIERLPAMLKRAFYEGFNFTREGWNGECAFDHLAPDGLTLEEKSATTVSAILADHDAKKEARAINGSCGTGNTETLTDAELEAIERAAFVSDQAGLEKSAATLRTLLEKLT